MKYKDPIGIVMCDVIMLLCVVLTRRLWIKLRYNMFSLYMTP